MIFFLLSFSNWILSHKFLAYQDIAILISFPPLRFGIDKDESSPPVFCICLVSAFLYSGVVLSFSFFSIASVLECYFLVCRLYSGIKILQELCSLSVGASSVYCSASISLSFFRATLILLHLLRSTGSLIFREVTFIALFSTRTAWFLCSWTYLSFVYG